jgi:MerR family gold-responsive transcriptional activator of gol and ges genes
MNIGEAARLSEVSAKMIRKYEELGIIPKAGRSGSGYRTYKEEDIHVLRFVRRARLLGFSMKEIKELLKLWKNKNRSSSQVKRLTSVHIESLEQKRREIDNMLKTLKNLSGLCHGDEKPDCAILDGLVK